MHYRDANLQQILRKTKAENFQSSAIDSAMHTSGMAQKITNVFPFPAESFTRKLAQNLPELFDLKLKDILASAWNKYRQVEQCMELSSQHPEETYLIPMIDHSITSEHHPQIEISIDKQTLGRIEFDLLLELKLRGIILKIKNSQISDATNGSCQCKIALKCEGFIVLEEQSEVWEFGNE